MRKLIRIIVPCNAISKSKMISRRQGGGDEAYNLKVTRCTYGEEADDDANKDSALIYNWYKS